MMKKILCLLPGLAIMLALSGCCANDVCVCNDKLADALFFRFSRRVKVGNGINSSDIDTIIISRTSHPDPKLPTATVIRTDSVLVGRRPIVPSPNDTLVATVQEDLIINNAAPFPSAGGNTKLSAYDYRISLYKSRKVVSTYRITHIQLQGQYKATGCCTCYENTGKALTLGMGRDTMRLNVTDSLPGTPRIVRLRR